MAEYLFPKLKKLCGRAGRKLIVLPAAGEQNI